MSKIVIFSPHLDDAVLDLCEHIWLWKSLGYDVTVVTVFTSFGGRRSVTTAKLERVRKLEDRKAMHLLNVKWKHLNFIDGGFRVYKKTLVYSNFNFLFSGKVALSDSIVSERLKSIMIEYGSFDRMIVPLGIGNHVDHILVRNAAENIFPNSMLGYYTDYPYALDVKNWNLAHITHLFRAHKSVIQFHERKTKYLECYASQLPLLFKNVPKYPEIFVSVATIK